MHVKRDMQEKNTLIFSQNGKYIVQIKVLASQSLSTYHITLTALFSLFTSQSGISLKEFDKM